MPFENRSLYTPGVTVKLLRKIMNKSEVITLSSDDESDFIHNPKSNINSSTKVQPGAIKSYSQKFSQITINKTKGKIVENNKPKVIKLLTVPEKKCKMTYKVSPEVVDLEDYSEKTNTDSLSSLKAVCSSPCESAENHSQPDIIDICDVVNKKDASVHKETDPNVSSEDVKTLSQDLPLSDTELKQENITNYVLSDTDRKNYEKSLNEPSNVIDEGANQNLKFFTEFVEFCGSLENIPNDRTRLTKKLMKKYGEADNNYIKSQDFVNFIQMSKAKINRNNLYLIAKEITDELSYRKKVDINADKSDLGGKKFQENHEALNNNEIVLKNKSVPSKRQIKFINKIFKKLDKLGNKIRELEEQEVDLSDEEESSYVQLHRYRERFCQIYAKICKYTNEPSDAGRVYSRKICFTESKYPAINKCIENWLNKTKRFPDFTDIMKLLESQSTSLNLPSNRESIRAIAIEIFQQVGAMLQRRRRYDLWDSCCGFISETDDPAISDPALNEALKRNFENRIKKENEIFQYFVELQEKERLEPEEVPDEEASHSPVDSGNEDEKEIEEIENSLNKKLDEAIKNTDGKDNSVQKDDSNEGKSDSEYEKDSNKNLKLGNNLMKSKESKNNYKNCKSLKWRSDNNGKAKNDDIDSRDLNRSSENGNEESLKDIFGLKELKGLEDDKGDSDLELIAVENVTNKGICKKIKPVKRTLNLEEEIPKKKKFSSRNEKETKKISVFEIGGKKNIENTNKVFNVQCCQIFTDSFFEDMDEEKKDWGKRKVFRDLTNVKRLLEPHGKKKKMYNLFSPSFFRRSSCEFEKSCWKKRFKVSFRLVTLKYQKCALNHGDKSGKTLSSKSDTDKKNFEDSSDRTEDERGTFLSSHGNGSEDDNNEDENEKNGKTDSDKNQHEEEDEDEDEDEDENEEENEGEKDSANSEPICHSFPSQKTEESTDSTAPSENEKNLDENGKVELSTAQDVPVLESTYKNGDDQAEKETPATDSEPENVEKTSKTTEERNEMQLCSETDEIKVLEKKAEAEETEEKCDSQIECMNTTQPLIKNQKEHSRKVRKDNSKIKRKVSTNEDKCEEKKCSEAEKNNSRTETDDRAVEVLEDAHEKGNSTAEAPKNKKSSITSSKDLIEVEAENEGKTITSETTHNSENPERNFNSKGKNLATVTHKDDEKANVETPKREAIESKPSTIRKLLQFDPTGQKLYKRNTPSTSDEERVKRFLLHSPASISITPPRKLSLTKPPSQAALQALATLRNLKGISATIVRGKPRSEDDVVVIGGSYKRNVTQISNPSKRIRGDLPVISSVQSIDSTTPKIVTVQGNVSGFDNSWPEASDSADSQFNSSSIRISNVWGSLPDSFMPSGQNSESVSPGCSSRQSDVRPNKVVKKKTAKKPVEYVVLE